jgi:photosystem II stability/assembly factor-like uncharacterized protein
MAFRTRGYTLVLLVLVATVVAFASPLAADSSGWFFQTSPTTTNLNDVQALDSSTAVAVGEAGTILKTTDGGGTWVALPSGTSQPLRGVHFLDASNGWAVGGTILKTVNGGSTWSEETGPFTTLQDVHFLSSSVGVAVGSVGSQGFLRTTNGGDTWTALDIGSTGTNRPQALFFIDDLRGFAVGLNAAMISTTCDVWGQCTTTYVSPKTVVWKTTDGGLTWSPYVCQTGSVRFLQGVFFVDELTGWAVGDNGLVLKTTSGGTSWTALPSGTSASFYATAFVSATTGWVVGSDGVLRKTTDGGTSWIAQGTAGSPLNGVDFVGGATGWAVGNGGKIVKTTDAGGGACTYELSPPQAAFPGGGGSGSVSVTAPGLCGWTAASDAAWLTIAPGGTGGAGNGAIGYSMGYNLTGALRTGHITVQGQVFTVDQSACGSPTYTLSPPASTCPSEGASGSFGVNLSGPGCWTATSDASWLRVTSGGSGLESGTVGYRAEANVATSTRTGHITVGGETFTLDQSSCGPACPALTVSTWAGTAGQSGSVDDTGPAARFYYPRGVAVDQDGNGYVADSENHTIRRISPTGVVTTLAGTAGQAGSTDAAGGSARFRYPRGVAVDGNGNVYVGDTDNHTIRKIAVSTGEVTTLAGTAGAPGTSDDTGAAARFDSPIGVAVDSSGYVYVGDSANHTIRKVSPAGEVTTLAGLAGAPGSSDGSGSAARFNYPYGVAVDGAGYVYVADSSNGAVRKLAPDGQVTTLASGLSGPYGVAATASGTVYVSNTNQYDVRRIFPALGAVPVAGLAGSSGSADGTGTTARFFLPALIAADSSGNVYVADRFNHTIRRATPPASMEIAASSGEGQSAPVGAPVPVAPAVIVRDDQANPVPGVGVRFAVASGGGSLTGATQTTGSDGVATVGGWTLGAAPGTNTLTAAASWVTGSPVTFSATGVALPSLSINDVSVPEGNAGTAAATFGVTLSTASPLTVTVAYATANGTATAGSDYVAASGTLTFPPGATTRSIPVTVNGDTLVEPNETFFVNLSAATNATIADAQGVGTINNDDFVAPGSTSFYTLTPCRMLDTRDIAGALGGPALQPGAQRTFALAGPKCGIPPTATAVSMNVTVTGATTPGNVRLFPAGVSAPEVSTINFVPGQTRANNAIVKLGGGATGSVVVLNSAAGAVDFILDVNGYFE